MPATGVKSVSGLPAAGEARVSMLMPWECDCGSWALGCSLCQQLPRDCGPEHLGASTWRAQRGHSKHQPLGWDQQSEIPVPVVSASRAKALGDGAGLCAGGIAGGPCAGLCLWMCPALCPAQPERWPRLSEQAGCECPRAGCVCRERRFLGTPPQPRFSQAILST